MPYLKQEDKAALDAGIATPTAPGDLNYLVTKQALAYLDHGDQVAFEYNCGRATGLFLEANGGFTYTNYNNAVGALVCARLEFERRTSESAPRKTRRQAIKSLKEMVTLLYDHEIVPYEKAKIKENGDVYP